MLTFACVLRSGGDYTIHDSIVLSRQVRRQMLIPHRFVCLSDLDIQDDFVECIPLEKNWPGWWSVVELFRLTGPTIVTGLDTLIIDCIDRLGELALTCPVDDFYMTIPQPKAIQRGEKWCSGMMIWNGDWSWLYDQFKISDIQRFKKEQRYTTHQLTKNKINVRLLQNEFDGFYSYKNDVMNRKIPEDAKVIAFHGHPRPSECKEKWIVDLRNDMSVPFHFLADVLAKKEQYETKIHQNQFIR